MNEKKKKAKILLAVSLCIPGQSLRVVMLFNDPTSTLDEAYRGFLCYGTEE